MNTNDETIIENVSKSEPIKKEAKPVSQTSKPMADPKVQPKADEAPKSKQSSWKQVTMGGVSGIALGAAGILFSGATLPDNMIIGGGNSEESGEEDIAIDVESPLAPGIESEAGITVASCVDDDMSFSEAFAAARHEVGANGAFVWHGQVYSTCYAEEWNALSPEEQNAFSSNALAAVNGQSSDELDNVTSDNNEPLLADNENQGADDDSVEVHVLGVEENVVTDDGEIINVGVAEVEGHSAVFIDGDADGTFDLLAVDVNDDGYIDVENELFDVDNPDMSVEAFNNQADSIPTDPVVDDMYAQMPDYTNDADVSSLV